MIFEANNYCINNDDLQQGGWGVLDGENGSKHVTLNELTKFIVYSYLSRFMFKNKRTNLE